MKVATTSLHSDQRCGFQGWKHHETVLCLRGWLMADMVFWFLSRMYWSAGRVESQKCVQIGSYIFLMWQLINVSRWIWVPRNLRLWINKRKCPFLNLEAWKGWHFFCWRQTYWRFCFGKTMFIHNRFSKGNLWVYDMTKIYFLVCACGSHHYFN